MEFCIHLVLAEQRIELLRAERRELDAHAQQEQDRIMRLQTRVLAAADAAEVEHGESMSQLAVTRVKAAAQDAIATTLATLQAKLEADRAAISARDSAEREGCLAALGKWIALHEAHEGTWSVRATLDEVDGYDGETAGSTSFGLEWKCVLELADAHPMRQLVHVGDLLQHVELAIPEPGGWLKKGKVRPQRLDQYCLESFFTDGSASTFSLRATPRMPAGLDIETRDDEVNVTVAGTREPLAVDISGFEAQRLLLLRDRIRDLLTSHDGVQRRVIAAYFDDAPLADHQNFVEVAKRLIDASAPIVQEIRNHSLSPSELVIRRPLRSEDTRRSWEEIFVSTKSLLDKIGRLPRALRGLWAPFGLEVNRATTPPPFAALPPTQIAEVRPVVVDDEPEVTIEPGPPAEASGVVAQPSRPQQAESVAQSLGSIIIDPSVAAEVSEAPKQARIEIDASNKEALAATVKRIVRSAREGRTPEAYEAYAALFENDDFARQRVQDQRQVLKLMVLAKTLPPRGEAVTHAYERARARLEALVADGDDPVDREMLARCEELLGDDARA